MSSREQKKYIETLKRYEKKFENKELAEYKMFVKRHKDDEDLDKLSMQKLEQLYQKYHLNREKKNYEHFFKNPNEDKSN